MRKYKIATYLFLLSFLLGFINVHANIVVDSVLKEQIIKVGRQKLQNLIQLNEQYIKEGKPDKLSFVVSVNPEDYINDISISGKPNFLSTATIEGSYSARLNQIYQSEGIECYFILINCFDVKMTAEMPVSCPLEELFKEGSFFDKSSNIQSLKFLHEVITRNILYDGTVSNRKRYVLSFANYCCSEFNSSTMGTGCFRLYTVNSVNPVNSSPVVYFDEIYDYYKSYLKKDQAFLKEPLRDLTVDKMITDFEKSVKNYKKKAIILQTNTTNELEALLSFFTSEDRQLLSNEERRHILKVFCANSIYLTTEIEILNILNATPRDSVNVLLTDLATINVNGKRLLKHLFDKFQQGDYKELVKRLVQMVGNSTLYQHNLPDVEASLIANQISPAWSRVFEWSDCSNTTMYMDEQNTDECKRPSHWQHGEKRYFTITMSNIGSIEINGKCKKVEAVASNGGPYNVSYENITPSSLNPYDLIVLVDKSTISGLNDITESSGGTMVVPAFFLVYAKDKAFNRDLFEATMALTAVVGPEEILASKLLSKLSGFKRLLKFVRKGENLLESANLALYPNIRNYLGNSGVKQHLNTSQLYGFEEIIRRGNNDVLGYINQMDEYDFVEMVRGYKDLIKNNKLSTFENAIKNVNDFYGEHGWLSYWRLTPGIKYSLTTINDLRSAGMLLPTGNATDIQLGSLQAFTRKGDFINIPVRYNKAYLGEYAEKGYQNVLECLEELRKQPERLFKGDVYSGKAFSRAVFDNTFIGGNGKLHNYASFISTSKLQSVAEGFVSLTKKWAGEGEKVAVIQRIISKDGVYIDDLSDWGEHLGTIRHPDVDIAIQVQREVVLNPGNLKQIGEPIAIMENGIHKTIDGMKAYYVDLIQF